MIILIHSAETKGSIAANIGGLDYSYYFVLKKYQTVLEQFATVIEIRYPESEVDAIYRACEARGEPCLFLSFTPPFKTVTDLACPTISVFAWEYLTLPTDVWGGDSRNDWRTVFRKHGCAITHSSFAVRAVQKAMGEDFPVWSIPAPVWEDYTKLYREEKIPARSNGFNLSFEGVVIDFQGCVPVATSEVNKTGFVERRSSDAEDKKVKINLEGIIYTTVFNPNDGRKNWTDLLWAFCWAFRDVEDVTLVMKLAYFDFEAIRGIILGEIQKLTPFKCRVVALHGFLNDQDYARLIQESTYVVNTAHGEGQCLPLMEYMSAGKPAIAPRHTAMEDYVNEHNAFVVGSNMEWYHWPHDSRQALRTFRYRINWESLYLAYQESFDVAKNDPDRYMRMSRCAVESLQKYCSKAVAEERLQIVFRERGVLSESALIAACRKIRHKAASRVPNAMRTDRFRRIIASLRWSAAQARLLRDSGWRARSKALVRKMGKPLAQRAASYIKTRPGLGLACMHVAMKLGIDKSLRSVYQKLLGHPSPTGHPKRRVPVSYGPLANLTPRARRLYAELKTAIEKNKEKR